jgi:hypothetical protein
VIRALLPCGLMWLAGMVVASNHMQRKHVCVGNQAMAVLKSRMVISKHVYRRRSEALEYCEYIML